MSAYILDLATYATLFKLDLTTKEEKRIEVEWTGKPLESGVNVARHGITKEDTFRIDGMVTAWPLIGPTLRNPQRVVQADLALEALAKAKLPLTLIMGWWTPTVTIKVIASNSDVGTGEALRMAIDVTTITLAVPVYTTIPASRLNPAIRKRNAPGSTGGAAAGKPASPTAPKYASVLAKIFRL